MARTTIPNFLAGIPLPFALVLMICVAPGCLGADEEEEIPEEDLTIVVEADKSRLLAQEEELQKKSSEVQEEQDRLAQQKAELTQKLSTLSKKDRKQRGKLEAEQRRLEEEEKRIRQRASKFESEKSKLDRQKNELLERITTLTKRGKGGLTIEQREQMVARREKQVAEREAKLGNREAKIANIESQAAKALQEINQVLAELKAGGGMTRTVVVSSPAGSGGTVTRGQANRARQQARAKIDSKGLLMEDLTPVARSLNKQGNDALGSKDYPSAASYFTQLQEAVDRMQVNRDFVSLKMNRINEAAKSEINKLDPKRRKKVQSLLVEIGEAFNDGRYDRANRKANQIAALLRSS